MGFTLEIIALSKDTQAFALFSEGRKPIEVAIKLDLGADSYYTNSFGGLKDFTN